MKGSRQLTTGLMFAVVSLAASGQNLISVKQALSTKYTLTTTTADKMDIVRAGDVLVLRKSKLVGMDATSKYLGLNRYANGRIVQSGVTKAETWMKFISKDANVPDRTFVSGEKLWVTSIDVQETGATFTLLSDPIQDVRYEAKLTFPFGRGVPADPKIVLERVAEVFELEPAGPAQAIEASPSVESTAPQAPSQTEPGQAPQQLTTFIRLGQTQADVTNALGPATRAYNEGPNQVCEYGSLKVILKGGRVIDVQ